MASNAVPITYGTAYTVLVYSLERLQLERERRGMTSDLGAAPDIDARVEASAVLHELARAQDARCTSDLERFSDAAIHLAYCNNFYWTGEYKRQPPETLLREGPCVHRREEIGGALLRYLAERIMVYQHKLH